MPTKRYYATRDLKNPSGYGTRMLRAGDPIDLDGPKARLYMALGAVSREKPKPPIANATEPRTAENTSPASPTAKPKAKRAPRKKAAAPKK